MKIGIGVHGRFHAFELARALIEAGQDVTVFTNYPAFIAERFGVPRQRVVGHAIHGVAVRFLARLDPARKNLRRDLWLHEWFGRWLAGRLKRKKWDVTYTWSGVSEEHLLGARTSSARLMARGSAHIRTQAELLEAEAARTGVPQEQPSPLIMAREEREYSLADAVVTLSSWSRQTFLDRGFSPGKVRLMISGTRVTSFQGAPEVLAERSRRIAAGEPLRILNVGTFSYRKGVHDLAAVVRALPQESFQFRFVGTVAPEAAKLAEALRDRVEFIPRVPQQELMAHYAWGDIFIFPTIEDGFPAVMAQATAAGLPQLATPNGAGTDLVRENLNGWILPARSPERFVDRLQWCEGHRAELASMVTGMGLHSQSRDWREVAKDFLKLVADLGRPVWT